MQIVCPNCATSYEVQPAALGAAGRSVRCVRCKTVWRAAPPAPATPAPITAAPASVTAEPADEAAAFQSELGSDAKPESFDDNAIVAWDAPVDGETEAPVTEDLTDGTGAEPAAVADDTATPEASDAAEDAPAAAEADGEPAAEMPVPAEPSAEEEPPEIPPAEAPPLAPIETDPAPLPEVAAADDNPHDIESVAARRPGPRRRKRPQLKAPRLPMVIVGLIGVLAARLAWRGQVVRYAPQTASLYAAVGLPVNLRGMVFTDVKTVKDTHDGVSVLVVEGTVANVTSVPLEVPRLRFAVRNEAGNEIYAWTAMPAQTVLPAGEKLPFRSRLASPPTESRAIEVRFYNRRDAAAAGGR